jgi:hypothetical protein
MVVTQHEIDAAILRAEDAKQKLYLDIETRLKTGCSIDDCDVEMYRNLRNAIFLLENSSQFLVQDCITTREIWEQIIFINQNTCVTPTIKDVVDNFMWLITNLGKDILTNTNYKIKTN